MNNEVTPYERAQHALLAKLGMMLDDAGYPSEHGRYGLAIRLAQALDALAAAEQRAAVAEAVAEEKAT